MAVVRRYRALIGNLIWRHRVTLGFVAFILIIAFVVGRVAYRADQNAQRITLSICAQIGLLEGAKATSRDPELLADYIAILKTGVDRCPVIKQPE